MWYIIGIPSSSGLAVNVRRLSNWIFEQEQNTVVHSRLRSSRTHCVVTLFKAKLISRVNVKYKFASFQNIICNFVEKWNTYNVFCKVEIYNIAFEL